MASIDIATCLTSRQAAKALNLSTDTVKTYCQRGLIAGVKAGNSWLIPKAEVERYKRDRQAPGRPRKEN
ncbi:MAG: helix-turn-helix domain-containing protein [Planctomycetales bacterium]|nr:helix-turn-helix domain-containing protein [Planctomycetales bacterium]